MSNNYNDFFAAAKNAKDGTPRMKSTTSRPSATHTSTAKRAAAAAASTKKQKAKKNSLVGPLVALIGFAGALSLYLNYDQIEVFISKIEVQWLGTAEASTDEKPANSTEGKEKSTAAKGEKEEKSAGASTEKEKPAGAAESDVSEEEISHYTKLNERKKELDQREEELNELEKELHQQKGEVEARIKKLEELRMQIAQVLKEKVQVDEEKVNRLVEFYSNMKPQQAAQIMANLNEDLTVEIIGKMKKKNAADIMNLLKPEKAQSLTEMFAGYKRK